MHVDDFIEQPSFESKEDYLAYSKWVLNYFRLPSTLKNSFAPFMQDNKLFGIYKDNKKYRVTGASRLGDVWLATDSQRTVGYDLRVDVSDISNWSPE